MNDALQELLVGQSVWRCRDAQAAVASQRDATATVSTGYAALDRYLPGGGWPLHTLLEVLSGDCGIGELRLLMPALAALGGTRDGYVVWVTPPYRPYAPALAQWGLDVSRVLLIHPDDTRDALWATEQALASGNALAVLSWVSQLDIRDSRRLQLAAAANHSWAVVFRPVAARHEPSAAAVRLALRAGSTGSEIDFFKVRGARPRRICGYDAFHGHWPRLDAASASPSAAASSTSGP